MYYRNLNPSEKEGPYAEPQILPYTTSEQINAIFVTRTKSGKITYRQWKRPHVDKTKARSGMLLVFTSLSNYIQRQEDARTQQQRPPLLIGAVSAADASNATEAALLIDELWEAHSLKLESLLNGAEP